MSIKGKRVAFLGAGNMGEALIKGLTQTGLVPPPPSPPPTRGPTTSSRWRSATASAPSATIPRSSADADVIILAVKPQIMGAVLKQIASVVDDGKLLISIAAGVSTQKLREHLGKPARLIRVMPNTPAVVLEG